MTLLHPFLLHIENCKTIQSYVQSPSLVPPPNLGFCLSHPSLPISSIRISAHYQYPLTMSPSVWKESLLANGISPTSSSSRRYGSRLSLLCWCGSRFDGRDGVEAFDLHCPVLVNTDVVNAFCVLLCCGGCQIQNRSKGHAWDSVTYLKAVC